MPGFLVELRMYGYAKQYAKQTVYCVAKKFRVKGVTRKKVVPHVSLYGPGKTNDMAEVIAAIEKVGRRYTVVPFKVKGYGYFDTKPKVIYLAIRPSQELKDLTRELSRELRKVSTGQSWDKGSHHAFHATIAFHDIDRKFNQIWSYLKSEEQPNIDQHLLRITVVGKGRRIVCEYDLLLKRLLNRRQALSRFWWRRTWKRLRQLQGVPAEKPTSLADRLKRLFGLD